MAVIVPKPSVRWLSMPNGPGDPLLTDAYYVLNCFANAGCSSFDKQSTPFVLMLCKMDIQYCGGEPPYEPVKVLTPVVRTAFADVLDLGFGRMVHCAQKGSGSSLMTLCWALTHGADPGTPGFNDPAANLSAAHTEAAHRGTTAIFQDKAGLSFFAFNTGFQGSIYSEAQPIPSVKLDTEGPKNVPHACLACHGGRLNPKTNRVEGATFLPIEPKSIVISRTPADEESIRAINAMMLNSRTMTPTMAAYVNGMYNGAVAQANDAFIPPGWTAQAGLYRDIVRPYCASCHMAQTGYLAFATWNDFLASKVRIQQSVCVARSMPHAEVPYQKFWTAGGSTVFLPGVLSASLGYPKCP
jgi:hypothetical protein